MSTKKRDKDLAKRLKNASSSYNSPQLQRANDDNDNIVFSFQSLQNGYDLNHKSLTKENKVQLLKKLVEISKTTWNSLILKDKKSGFELIDKSIITGLPNVVTEDISKLYILRFASQDCRIIGFRQDNVYHILYIDPDLSLYRH